MRIPTFHYFEDGKKWKFLECDEFLIPANLNRNKIIVEGKIEDFLTLKLYCHLNLKLLYLI